MRKDTEDRRQAGRDVVDEAAPRDHLPPGSEAAIDDVAPDEAPPPEAAQHDPIANQGPQRTPGEAGDGVRRHNEGQARQGPR